jgi:hypothetical protein
VTHSRPLGGVEPDATPEALFATFLDALRDLHARGGMRDVLRLAVAASGSFGRVAPPRDGPSAPSTEASTLDDVNADELFETLIAALERAFCRGGLEEVMAELSMMGAVVRRAAGARGAAARRRARPIVTVD